MTSASIYQAIENYNPTLLIDEADTFLHKNRHLVGILNSGHTRNGAYVIRASSKGTPKRYSTWGAKAISGIGNMPETIMDRGVIMPLRRMLPDERVLPLRESEEHFKLLRSSLARWSIDNAFQIPDVTPSHHLELNDRQNDNWRPLFAIAELAGGDWPNRARSAAIKYSDYSISNCTSNSSVLLSDIFDIFQATGVDRISSKHLVESLCTCKPRLWGNFNKGTPINFKQIRANLSHFDISSNSTRFDTGENIKGYHRRQFEDAFQRYLPNGADED